jgi:hypothetical protein
MFPLVGEACPHQRVAWDRKVPRLSTGISCVETRVAPSVGTTQGLYGGHAAGYPYGRLVNFFTNRTVKSGHVNAKHERHRRALRQHRTFFLISTLNIQFRRRFF